MDIVFQYLRTHFSTFQTKSKPSPDGNCWCHTFPDCPIGSLSGKYVILDWIIYFRKWLGGFFKTTHPFTHLPRTDPWLLCWDGASAIDAKFLAIKYKKSRPILRFESQAARWFLR